MIQNTPSEKYPDMVTVVKTIKSKKEMMNRRYINLRKCILQIDEFERVKLFDKKMISTRKTRLSKIIV